MKKIVTIIIALLSVYIAQAQGYGEYSNSFMEMFRIVASIIALGLIMLFILNILKKFLDNRLKNKIVEKGISENIASSVLQTSVEENRNVSIKWFCILLGSGAGFLIINYTQPLGFHSLAIMSFSIALSFLGYYFFTRIQEK